MPETKRKIEADPGRPGECSAADASVVAQLAALKQMTVVELKTKWKSLFGAPAPNNSRGYLELRLGYRIQELKPSETKGKTYKAAEGVVIGSDSWRPTALTLLAIAESEDPNIVDRPGDMMRIASSYANAGLPLLFSMLDDRGDDTALDYLCDEIEEFVH